MIPTLGLKHVNLLAMSSFMVSRNHELQNSIARGLGVVGPIIRNPKEKKKKRQIFSVKCVVVCKKYYRIYLKIKNSLI